MEARRSIAGPADPNRLQDIDPATSATPIIVDGGVSGSLVVERMEFILIQVSDGDERKDDEPSS